MNNETEKQFQKIKYLLTEKKKILIMAHENPDADAIGSMLALSFILEKMGHQVFLFSPDELPEYLNFLSGFGNIVNNLPLLENVDLAFCLDYGDFRRLRFSSEFSEEKIVTIDHHLESTQKGIVKIIDSKYSSTAEIVYFLACYLGIEIDKNIATCLLSGILYDTGGLRHISTSPQTLRVVSDLLSRGISLEDISQKTLTSGKSLIDSKIWAEVLSRVVLDQKRKFVFSWVSFEDFEKYQISISDLDGIASLISTVSDASFSLFLIENEKGKIKGSLRSEPHKAENIIGIAKFLGGNGHSFAAGFKQEGSIEEVLQKVYNFIDNA
jgi:phosphoesterase RecJ-like protein